MPETENPNQKSENLNSEDEVLSERKGADIIKKVSLTKEKKKEKEEKLKALTKANIIKKKIQRLDVVSNVLFLVSFVLIIFIILRYLFYICYGLGQCEDVNWFIIVGVLAILVVFLIMARVEKKRVKTAIAKFKESRSKKDVSIDLRRHSREKLRELITQVSNLRAKVGNEDTDLKNAYRDLYLIFKSFLSEYFQIPKAMSTTKLIEHISSNQQVNPQMAKYSADLLENLFEQNYSDSPNPEALQTLAETAQRVMMYLASR